ncbi:MAG: hypothetical protein IPJ84_18120 [Bdellovibrionales bacterium]|nr:hypothetical protein [Bdellovibrionales bacterium]
MTETRSSTPRILAIAAAVIAVGFHSYLLKTHYELNYGEATGKLLCDISSTFSCSAASASRFSEFLGVPMALWGLIANLGYILLAAWESISSPESRNGQRTALLLLAGILAGASVIMGVISAVALNSICPFCLATYVLSLVTAFGAWKSYATGLRFKIQAAPLILGGLLIVGGFIANDIMRSSYAGPSGDAMTRAALAEWRANPNLEIAETDPLAMGPERAKAKLTLIEFADFRCIHCKMAVQPMKAFLASHPDTRRGSTPGRSTANATPQFKRITELNASSLASFGVPATRATKAGKPTAISLIDLKNGEPATRYEPPSPVSPNILESTARHFSNVQIPTKQKARSANRPSLALRSTFAERQPSLQMAKCCQPERRFRSSTRPIVRCKS